MQNTIEIRQLTTLKELDALQKVEESVWHMPPTPIHQTYTALNHGGVLLGAFDEEKMIGFIYSFAGFDGKEPYLCSHMLGILYEYRKDGLGMKMKFKQAEIAEKMGYPMMTWTFDPLESLNAYLNLHKIGAVGAYYKENHYGSMDDGLNQGLPTDRIQIEWRFNERRSSHALNFDKAKILLKVNMDGHPIITDTFKDNVDLTSDGWFVAIPERFQSIKQKNPQLGKEWRFKTRKVFQSLFLKGFKAVDVIRDDSNPISYYYFSK
ncbi:GNAT family N-acetyltransferase [Virgibacillus ndiopensis]|uniref:GNAT family N-acetyltransferase n=1 Tax=Virgibacillus ndiopensis TaxID=2004408 RepID=UPI000C07DA96|nr:GNAT family N-acetyltransferase [Virgibacillus ndiopensis]